jgi:hypothetical protein
MQRPDDGDAVSADGETITVLIPLTIRKRVGRKLVVTPDGAEWASRPRVNNAMGQGAGAGVPVAEYARERGARDAGGFGSGKAAPTILCYTSSH